MQTSASVLLGSVGAVFMFADIALAASDQDLADCRDKDNADRRIAGCTRIIDDVGDTAKNRAIGYNNQGITYLDKGDNDRALTDLNEAIRIDPDYATAYGLRVRSIERTAASIR